MLGHLLRSLCPSRVSWDVPNSPDEARPTKEKQVSQTQDLLGTSGSLCLDTSEGLQQGGQAEPPLRCGAEEQNLTTAVRSTSSSPTKRGRGLWEKAQDCSKEPWAAWSRRSRQLGVEKRTDETCRLRFPPTSDVSYHQILSTDTQEGAAGLHGKNGNKGAKGDRGLQGQKGQPGGKGDPGITGDIGRKGSKGLRGLPGHVGVPGAAGTKGEIGSPGRPGIPGSDGPYGPKGGQGVSGDDGASGIPGEKGEKGAKGVPGLGGFKGQMGLPGKIGVAGPDGPQGPQGQPGPQGPRGKRGRPQLCLRGPPGMDGQKGEKGENGPAGQKGEKGDPGLSEEEVKEMVRSEMSGRCGLRAAKINRKFQGYFQSRERTRKDSESWKELLKKAQNMTTSATSEESFMEPTSFLTAASSDKQIMEPSQHKRHEAHSQLPAPCLQPMDEGSCQRYALLWYYHPEADACRPFVFGGCRGNGNRFETKWKCEQQCKTAAATRDSGQSPKLAERH